MTSPEARSVLADVKLNVCGVRAVNSVEELSRSALLISTPSVVLRRLLTHFFAPVDPAVVTVDTNFASIKVASNGIIARGTFTSDE